MICDFLYHTINILQHIVVPEPDYLVALVDKPFITPGIRTALIMLAAINLDYDPFLKTDKILNIPAHRLLLAKLYAQLLPAYFIPQLSLNISHVFP
jgi:hypothetical protein